MEFRDRFVELVNDACESSGLKVVFQGLIGGGDFSANGQKKTTHMQRRDIVSGVVFDVFYEEGYESKAEDFQKSMKDLLGSSAAASTCVCSRARSRTRIRTARSST